MDTLTVPKIKDLVNKPHQQYKDIFDTMQQNVPTKQPTIGIDTKACIDPMSDELSSFLSDLKKTTLPSNANANDTMGYSMY